VLLQACENVCLGSQEPKSDLKKITCYSCDEEVAYGLLIFQNCLSYSYIILLTFKNFRRGKKEAKPQNLPPK
jgi:hypothetical protein